MGFHIMLELYGAFLEQDNGTLVPEPEPKGWLENLVETGVDCTLGMIERILK